MPSKLAGSARDRAPAPSAGRAPGCGGRAPRSRSSGTLLGALAAALVAGVLTAPGAGAQTFLTQDEALELAFPGARVERRTAYLDEDQLRRAGELAGRPVASGVVTHYVAHDGEAPVGAAYFDAHRVRTLDEVLMVVVGVDGRVRRVEVLRFAEPPDYLAPEGWLRQFEGRELDPELAVGRGIVNMTGATLTSRAASGAVRRVLALHAVIRPFGEKGSGGTVPQAPHR